MIYAFEDYVPVVHESAYVHPDAAVTGNVTIGRDSLVGRERTGPRTRVAIPLSDVRTVEARRTDPIGTAAVVLVTVIGVIALWGAYALRNLGTDY